MPAGPDDRTIVGMDGAGGNTRARRAPARASRAKNFRGAEVDTMKKTFEHLLDRRCDPAARAVLEDMLLERGKTVVAACGVGSGGVGGVGGVGGDGDGGHGGDGSGGVGGVGGDGDGGCGGGGGGGDGGYGGGDGDGGGGQAERGGDGSD